MKYYNARLFTIKFKMRSFKKKTQTFMRSYRAIFLAFKYPSFFVQCTCPLKASLKIRSKTHYILFIDSNWHKRLLSCQSSYKYGGNDITEQSLKNTNEKYNWWQSLIQREQRRGSTPALKFANYFCWHEILIFHEF